eukprot:SAG31_NODE_18607_length_629_cov_3.911321_1_plen_124_part_01
MGTAFSLYGRCRCVPRKTLARLALHLFSLTYCELHKMHADGENCGLANVQTSYHSNLLLHYSYAACASANSFANSDSFEDRDEGTRLKLNVVMAISLIEDITRLPTRDADIGLLAALGEIDTWD